MAKDDDYNAQITEGIEDIDAAPEEMEEAATERVATDNAEEAEEMAATYGPEEGTETAATEETPAPRDEIEKIADNMALSTAGALIVPDDEPAICITIAQNPNVKGERGKNGWQNVFTTFDAFERRFIQPVRSAVSVENYHKKTKADQSDIKSAAGGFLGGELEGHRRLAANVKNRILWNGDIDDCPPELFEKFKRGEGINFRGFLYTTFSHVPEAPRVRLIAPLSRPVTRDEYSELSPFICLKIERELKCKLFDEHGNSPAQLMYNAYAAKDGEYFFKDFRGPVLDVDALLTEQEQHGKEYVAELAALLHVDAAEVVASKPAPAKSKRKQPGDPRKREGIPGLFNRAYYPIQKAIIKFLPDVYKQEGPDRFTYIPGSAANGLSIMDNVRAYAWDATNNAVNDGKSYDAFELVAAHLYGGNDKAARADLKNDGGVKRQIFEERRDKVRADYLDFPEDDETPDIWKENLRADDNGRYLATPDNCALILENDPLFKNIAFNDMAQREEITGPVPWSRGDGAGKLFDETDRAEMLVLIDKVYECDFTDRALDTAIKTVTNRRRFHPFKNFLESLPAWDGRKRTAEILPRAFETPATDYTAAVVRKTLCAIITRAYHPGAKFDYVPVLDGEQGIGKTSFLKWLIGIEFYNGGITFEKMRSKSAAEDMQGYALAEFQELDGLNKVEARTARAFITETKDVYRAPYDRKAKEHFRTCVFWGTVNGYGGYLRDPEGNRRYWPIKCKRKGGAIWFKLFDENYRLQLWAEALAAYKFGESLTMEDSPALRAAALEAQNAAIEIDTRAGLVERYLSLRYPTGWDSMSISARIAWLNSDFKNEDTGAAVTGVLKEKVCAMEIFQEAWEGDKAHMNTKDRDDIRRIMAKIPGWELITEGRPRFPGYGQSQPAWRRVTEPGETERRKSSADVKNSRKPATSTAIPFPREETQAKTLTEAKTDALEEAREETRTETIEEAKTDALEETTKTPAEVRREKRLSLFEHAETETLRAGARGILDFMKDSGHTEAGGYNRELLNAATRGELIALLIAAEDRAASIGKDFERAARAAESAAFRQSYSELFKQRKAEEAAALEESTTAKSSETPETLEAWRAAARAIIAYLTSNNQSRDAGEIVSRYTSTGINGAGLIAAQNIVKDAQDFARDLSWGIGNAADDAIRSALGTSAGLAAGEVLKALKL